MRRIALLAALGLTLALPPGWAERDVRGNDAGVLYAAVSAEGRASMAVLARPDGCAPGQWDEWGNGAPAVLLRTLVTDDHLVFFTDETPADGDWQNVEECLQSLSW